MASRKRSAISSRSSIKTKSEMESSGDMSGGVDGDVSDPYSDNFVPSTFKVVELRALLHENDVAFPSTARKAGLIQAYEDEIRPRLDEIRAARNRDRNIRPKVEDVMDKSVDSISSIPSIKVDKDFEGSGNESDSSLHSAILSADSPRRGRRSVSWAEDVSGPEDEGEEERNIGNNSTFSINNPFQSPRLGPVKKVIARKSEPAPTSSTPVKEPRISAASNLFRNYMDPSITTNTYPRQIGKERRSPKNQTESKNDIKGEEQTIDSGNEGDLSRFSHDDSPSKPLKRQKKKSYGKLRNFLEDNDDDDDYWASDGNIKSARSIAWLLITITSITWWCWYVSESRTVGFCDTGRPSNLLLDQRMLQYEQNRRAIEGGNDNANVTLGMPFFLRPSCAPCPSHGQCQSGYLMGCDSNDYVFHKSVVAQLPFSEFLLPLSKTAPTCRTDDQKALFAADLADEIENRLRIKKGDVQCKRSPGSTSILRKNVSKSESDDLAFSISKDELKETLKVQVLKSEHLVSQPEEYFEELWTLALNELHQTDRIGEGYRGNPRIFAKRGAIGVNLRCWIGLVAQDIWLRMRVWVAVISAILLSLQWLRYRLYNTKSRQDKAKEIVASTLSRLEQAKISNSAEEGFLSISQLRDDILRSETSQSQRKKLWVTVVKLVEANTNVRTRQAKVKGEWSKVWEWVGSVDGQKVAKTSSSRYHNENGYAIVNEGKGRLRGADI